MAVPVAMIVFNRPEVTRRVFDAVARARPAQLFVIADGARADRAGEAARVAQVRAIFDAVDWPCTVHRNFSDTNLGCKRRVISGLDWLFDAVPEAIILEDDCVPAPGFFSYCAEMLERYRDQPRIFSVSGTNFARTVEAPAHYYSNYALMWGWATWRDRWAHYVGDPVDAQRVVRRSWWRRPMDLAYWRRAFDWEKSGGIDSWDYQWILTLWRHRALCVRPTMNLVENIGFGADATHTTATNSPLANLPVYAGDGGFSAGPAVLAADERRDA
ncbi:MAG: hypothetical protein ACRCUI_01400, partial [Polymorphobacter sp.]